jgi:ribosomal protein S28E/S33
VEFVKAGKVVAREVATVVSNKDIAAIAESRRPAANSIKVETLKGNDYLRVWVNRAGSNYLIHLPKAA